MISPLRIVDAFSISNSSAIERRSLGLFALRSARFNFSVMKYPGLRRLAVVSSLSQESKVQNRTVLLLVEAWHAVKRPGHVKIIKKKVKFLWLVVPSPACGLTICSRLIPRPD